MDLNKVMIIGRLTRDPEVKTIQSGQNVASFSVATSRQWKDQQGNPQSLTEFHNVVAWRKLADIAGQYLKKGKQVYIEGYLQTRSWDDQAGQKRYRTNIVVESLIMLGSKDGVTQPAQQVTTTESQQTVPAVTVGPVNKMQGTSWEPAESLLGSAPAIEEEEIDIKDITF